MLEKCVNIYRNAERKCKKARNLTCRGLFPLFYCHMRMTEAVTNYPEVNEPVRTKRASNRYTMGCPPVREDNPRALARGLSYVQKDKHGITI